MAALRQPQPEETGARPRLTIVPRAPDATVALVESTEGSPARGIVFGLALSAAAFWLPAALLLLHR
jgi:hypothetical protein